MSQGTRSFFFGATLSEIGFILFFALLLFAFYQKEADNNIIKEDQAQIDDLADKLEFKERQLQTLERVTQMTPEELDRFFTTLTPVINLEIENQNLEKENEGLQTQLEELSEVREALEKFSVANGRPAEEIQEALLLKKMIDDAFLNDPDLGLDSVSPKGLVKALKLAEVIKEFNQDSDTPILNEDDLTAKLAAVSSVQRSNDDLRGVVKNLRGRLGGRDLPPCWADKDTGKIEYLFKVIILDEGLVLTKAAPDYRTNEYNNLVNTTELTSGLTSLATFRKLATPILRFTDLKECRHYVSISDRSEKSYKSTLTIEDYFYKYVNRT